MWSLLSLGLICLVAVLVLRWLGRRTGAGARGLVRVLGRCYLEPRRSVYLIGVAGRCFLVGVGDGPMSLLAEIEQSHLPADPPTGDPSMSQLLARLLGKGKR